MKILDEEGTVSFTIGVWSLSLFCGAIYFLKLLFLNAKPDPGILGDKPDPEFLYLMIPFTVAAAIISIPIILAFGFIVRKVQKRKAPNREKKLWLTMFGIRLLLIGYLIASAIFGIGFEAIEMILGYLIGIPLGIWCFDLKEIED